MLYHLFTITFYLFITPSHGYKQEYTIPSKCEYFSENKDSCISPIEYMEPPICTLNMVAPLGLKKTYQYASLLFNTPRHSLNETQRNCIIHSSSAMSQDINTCVKQLTINPDSIPIQVARGLAQNEEGKWVSACASDMPCVEFRQRVQYFLMQNTHGIRKRVER